MGFNMDLWLWFCYTIHI